MELLLDPQSWLSFATLTVLEVVLGVDNLIFLSLLVDRLPGPQRASARRLGLGFAMLTRLALLFSIVWLAGFTAPLLTVRGHGVSGRALILFAGGLFLFVKSVTEILEQRVGARRPRSAGAAGGFWLVVLQIGAVDVVFSLDSVFTAVGLANHLEVMVAAIVTAVLFMLWLAALVGAFLDRHPSLKVLALAFLLLIGLALMAQGLGIEVPKGYLYFALGFSAAVEWLNIRLRAP